jgi:glucarate dehydratase
MGKATHQPLYNLLGGLYREKIEMNCYLFFRLANEEGRGGESTPEGLAEYARQCQQKYGFRVFKIKAGIAAPEVDVRTATLLRETLGADVGIVVDPNAAWSFPDAVGICKRLEKLDPLYIEDPCRGMEALSRLKRHINTPLSTNMCIVNMETLGIGLRLNPMPVDIILSDVHKWGGILATKKLAAACETLNLGVAHHSSPDVGISEAAILHIAASTPWMTIPLDSLQHHLADDVITKRFQYENGYLRVPEGYGLGVALDEEKVQKYADRYRRISAE